MNGPDTPNHAPILPQLEHLLVRAARRRAAPGLGRRRWLLVAIAAALVLAAGAAAAGILQVAGGETASGTFKVETYPPPAGAGGGERERPVCLQLRLEGRGPSYGCGEKPTVAKPFGLLVADSLKAGSGERVIYGLVLGDIARVSVLGDGEKHTDAMTEPKAGLPGRFFAVVVPDLGRIEVVGYDGAGQERARIGSRARPAHPPRSKAEAIVQGDPAGFAPTVPTPTSYIYKGKSITEAEATRMQLTCVQGREQFRCYDSAADVKGGP
jgi:hypothetical protein